jgi:hypothetical protein
MSRQFTIAASLIQKLILSIAAGVEQGRECHAG